MKTTDILGFLFVLTVLFIFARECTFEAVRRAPELSPSQGAVRSQIPQGSHRRGNGALSAEGSDEQ